MVKKLGNRISQYRKHLISYRSYLKKNLKMVERMIKDIDKIHIGKRDVCKKCGGLDIRRRVDSYFCRNCGYDSKKKKRKARVCKR